MCTCATPLVHFVDWTEVRRFCFPQFHSSTVPQWTVTSTRAHTEGLVGIVGIVGAFVGKGFPSLVVVVRKSDGRKRKLEAAVTGASTDHWATHVSSETVRVRVHKSDVHI